MCVDKRGFCRIHREVTSPFLLCLRRKLVQIERDWVPSSVGSSLYVRPTMVGTDAAIGLSPSEEAEIFVVVCPVI